MIANFFRNLELHGVESLLISGQATVLYGAATFSEDIDLWINPSEENRTRFLAALQATQARYYKLTPPFTLRNLQRGHGFHFVIPGGDSDEVYLDVMGQPPRVGSFLGVSGTAHSMETAWGLIRTIGVQPLVELKKTQRLEDYPIISRLALAWFAQPECKHGRADYLWALQNIFARPELAQFFAEHPSAIEVADEFDRDTAEFGRQSSAGSDVSEIVDRRVGERFHARIAELQRADRQYWRDIIAELRQFRAARTLMTEGDLVTPVI